VAAKYGNNSKDDGIGAASALLKFVLEEGSWAWYPQKGRRGMP
jgi:hypothetical protein